MAAESNTPWFVSGWFGVFASSPPEHWRQAADAIQSEVYRLRDELISPVELAKAKKQKAAELVFGRQTVQQIADSLGRNMIEAGDPTFDRHYVENIQKVTAEQIRDVARRYFVPGRLSRVIIAPPGGAPKSARSATAAEEGKVRLVTLDNGVKVLVKRIPHLPLVNVQAFVLGGSLAETEKTAGMSAMVADMLDKGTPHYTAQEIAAASSASGRK